MLRKTYWLAFAALIVIILAACQPETVQTTVVVTRLITETVEIEGTPIVVTRIVPDVQFVTATPEPKPIEAKNLIVCMAQEPESLYIYGTSMLVATAVEHGFHENLINSLSYDYQAQGLEKLPSLADGDAIISQVQVNPGDLIADAAGNVTTWGEGVTVLDPAGESITFAGNPIMLDQMAVDFTFKPLVWQDGTPVTADDSVFSFEVASDPDTVSSKFIIDRTSSYEAMSDLVVRWTGIPGWRDATYFLNVWQPLPRHQLGQFTAAELNEAEEANRLPLGNGPFQVSEWVAGDHITLVKNANYYRSNEGYPKLDSVTFKFIPDTNQLVAQLLAGQCDIGTQDGMDAGQAPFLIEAESQGLLAPYFQTGTVFEHIDFGIDPVEEYATTRPDWFEDVRVRQAMTMCTDRQSMVDNILYGRSEVIHSYVPQVHPLYPEDGITEWPFDVTHANTLLDEVGFLDKDNDGFREYYAGSAAGSDSQWDGTPFRVNLGTTAGNEMRQQLTQIFKENMMACGIDINLFYLPSSEWFANGPEGPLFGRKFDLGEFAWVSSVQPSCNLYLSGQTPGDPAEYPAGWGGQNETGWHNESFDTACQTALGSLPGTTEYEENHKEAQRIFSQDVPVIPLFLRLKVAAARPGVLNFTIDPTQSSEMWNLFEIDLQQ